MSFGPRRIDTPRHKLKFTYTDWMFASSGQTVVVWAFDEDEAETKMRSAYNSGTIRRL